MNKLIFDRETGRYIKQEHEYSVVREEKTIEENDGSICETVKGYDKKGRMVLDGVYYTYADGSKGHAFRSVSTDGYWEGGFGSYDKDGKLIHGGTFASEKFKE